MKEFHETHADIREWGGVTDPLSHNPEQFRYLVHAINPFAALGALTIMHHDVTSGIDHDEAWGDQTISMYEQPERLGERVSLSMSLIDQDHTATWGDAGLIIEAPEDNIVLTSTSDAGAHNSNLSVLLRQAGAQGIMNGDDLLSMSYATVYNEVVAVASRESQQVQLKGFFYKATQNDGPRNRQLADSMRAHASRLGLPAIAIKEQSLYAHDQIDTRNENLAIHFNGRRYLLEGFEPRSLFRVYDERDIAHFMNPHEIETVLAYAISAGMTETDATRIAKSYHETDRQRQAPKVEFDEDGTVKRVAYMTGYGDAETRVSIGKQGYGYRTNLAQEADKFQETMLTMGNPSAMMRSFGRKNIHMPISPSEADQMVTAACSELDEIKAGLVQKWYAEQRAVLYREWNSHLASLGNFNSYGSSVLGFYGEDDD